jgi:hypothetical protein
MTYRNATHLKRVSEKGSERVSECAFKKRRGEARGGEVEEAGEGGK